MRTALALLTLVLTGCGSSCNAPPLPQSDICELNPSRPPPTVTAVEIGQTTTGVFAPIVEDSAVELVVGGQGSDMVVAALRITGDGLTSCVAQRTVFEELDGDLITSEEAPMSTMSVGPGVVVTGSILLPYYGEYGARVRIRADVSGTTDSVEFFAGDRLVDAPADSPTPDARPIDARLDGPVPDAMPTDAAPDA